MREVGQKKKRANGLVSGFVRKARESECACRQSATDGGSGCVLVGGGALAGWFGWVLCVGGPVAAAAPSGEGATR